MIIQVAAVSLIISQAHLNAFYVCLVIAQRKLKAPEVRE